MTLKIIDETFCVCKVADYLETDLSTPFMFISSTDEEKSLVCPIDKVPVNTVERDDGWKAFRIEGTLDFSLIGILADISKVLDLLTDVCRQILPMKEAKGIGGIVVMHELEDGERFEVDDLHLQCFDIHSTKERQFVSRPCCPMGNGSVVWVMSLSVLCAANM